MKSKIITEDYVSFETAKLLAENRFGGICETSYYISNVGCENAVRTGDFAKIRPWRSELIAAPTLQMACKWLREVHDICIYCYNANSRTKQYGKYEAGASWISDDVSVIFNSAHSLYADTYEQAVEAVLKYCLTNLID